MAEIIGYTTGVFDLFHIGHLNILKSAKNMCNKLIVGITYDELVYERKNKYPIIPFIERVEIVKAIRYFDEIVLQHSMDKIGAWEKLKFNIMFVGDDWRGDSLFESVERSLKEFGARVEYFEYTKSVSSTKFTEILQEIYDTESKVR